MARRAGLFAGIGAALLAVAAHAQAPGLGQPLQEDELKTLPVTIYPDGRSLPPGSGRVSDGAELYKQHCAMCHGTEGIEGPAARLAGSDGFLSLKEPLRPLRIAKYPLLVNSVGAQWPYATSIFDYVRRAMPAHAPKSLANDEVYAITGYLLHLNNLVPAGATMDARSLPQVHMPGRDRGVATSP